MAITCRVRHAALIRVSRATELPVGTVIIDKGRANITSAWLDHRTRDGTFVLIAYKDSVSTMTLSLAVVHHAGAVTVKWFAINAIESAVNVTSVHITYGWRVWAHRIARNACPNLFLVAVSHCIVTRTSCLRRTRTPVFRAAEFIIMTLKFDEGRASFALYWLTHWTSYWTNALGAKEMTPIAKTLLLTLECNSNFIADNCVTVNTRKATIHVARVQLTGWGLGTH